MDLGGLGPAGAGWQMGRVTLTVVIKEMSPRHYDQILALWQSEPGVGLSEADSVTGVTNFLRRNPGFSFIAQDGQTLVGAVLCGHDGRRGYIHHLAVSAAYRRQGLGQVLVERCLTALRQAGIGKVHLFVFEDNQAAQAFWQETDWIRRDDLVVFSHPTHPPGL